MNCGLPGLNTQSRAHAGKIWYWGETEATLFPGANTKEVQTEIQSPVLNQRPSLGGLTVPTAKTHLVAQRLETSSFFCSSPLGSSENTKHGCEQTRVSGQGGGEGGGGGGGKGQEDTE